VEAETSLTGDTLSLRPRCALCGHVITARESVAVGIGRDCRRQVRAALRTADADARAVVLAAAAVLGVVL
jgi:hypothetical protein